jgi:hypothetical protein
MTSLISLCRNGAGRPSGTFGRRKAMVGPNRQATSVAQNSNLVFTVDGILIVFECLKYSPYSAVEHTCSTLQCH